MRLLPGTAGPLDRDPRHGDVAARRASAPGLRGRRRGGAALEANALVLGSPSPGASGKAGRPFAPRGGPHAGGGRLRTAGRARLRDPGGAGPRRHGRRLPGPATRSPSHRGVEDGPDRDSRPARRTWPAFAPRPRRSLACSIPTLSRFTMSARPRAGLTLSSSSWPAAAWPSTSRARPSRCVRRHSWSRPWRGPSMPLMPTA